MFGRLRFLLFYYLYWLLFFEAARLVFLIYHGAQAEQVPTRALALSFWYGLRMDLSLAAYLLVPVCLMALLSLWVAALRKAIAYKTYTNLLLFILLVLILADLQLFREWGSRLDATPLKYLTSPREVWATVSHLPVFWILLGFALVLTLIAWLTGRFINRIAVHLQDIRHRRAGSGIIFVLTLALIVPIRGGFQQTPINQSSVYFSSYNFANLLSVNAPWNFLHGVTNKAPTSNPYRYLPPADARRVADSLLTPSGERQRWLSTGRPNVILVIWESFTAKALTANLHGQEVTPNFNRLRNEGLYFANAFASGDRTDKGLAAVLSGYPALNNVSVIRFPAKSAKLQTLGGFFGSRDYATSFYYGGEPEFANMKSYILQTGYGNLVQKSDFASRDQNSKWGAHDGVVAERILNDLKARKPDQPFFLTWLTLTSHEPFETPEEPAFELKGNEEKFLNSIRYSDAVLGRFVQQCRQQPWWANTLLIIVADHGHPMPAPDNKFDNFRIPMLWIGGALAKTETFEPICSQLDLAQTLCGQLGSEQRLFPFSKDLAVPQQPWAFYTFNNGFGLVEADRHLVFDNVGRRPIATGGTADSAFYRKGKALQQIVYEDYLLK